ALLRNRNVPNERDRPQAHRSAAGAPPSGLLAPNPPGRGGPGAAGEARPGLRRAGAVVRAGQGPTRAAHSSFAHTPVSTGFPISSAASTPTGARPTGRRSASPIAAGLGAWGASGGGPARAPAAVGAVPPPLASPRRAALRPPISVAMAADPSPEPT